jgi:predicted nucleic acid-binding protein
MKSVARPDNPSTVYLDSSAVISAVKRETGHEPVAKVLELAKARALTLVTSTILLVEARSRGRDAAPDDSGEREILGYLDHPGWILVELDRAVALRARRLCLRFGLQNYDAVHLASAIEGGAEVLMTFDKGFPIGSLVEGVWVDNPYLPGSPSPGGAAT